MISKLLLKNSAKLSAAKIFRPAGYLQPRAQMVSPIQHYSFSTNNAETDHKGEKIDFGFKNVDYEEKQEKVREVFSNVADSYDLMNDAMSLGIHRVWKNEFVNSIGSLKAKKVLDDDGKVIRREPLKCLDVAGGTGDISFRILDKAWADSPDRK